MPELLAQLEEAIPPVLLGPAPSLLEALVALQVRAVAGLQHIDGIDIPPSVAAEVHDPGVAGGAILEAQPSLLGGQEVVHALDAPEVDHGDEGEDEAHHQQQQVVRDEAQPPRPPDGGRGQHAQHEAPYLDEGDEAVGRVVGGHPVSPEHDVPLPDVEDNGEDEEPLEDELCRVVCQVERHESHGGEHHDVGVLHPQHEGHQGQRLLGLAGGQRVEAPGPRQHGLQELPNPVRAQPPVVDDAQDWPVDDQGQQDVRKLAHHVHVQDLGDHEADQVSAHEQLHPGRLEEWVERGPRIQPEDPVDPLSVGLLGQEVCHGDDLQEGVPEEGDHVQLRDGLDVRPANIQHHDGLDGDIQEHHGLRGEHDSQVRLRALHERVVVRLDHVLVEALRGHRVDARERQHPQRHPQVHVQPLGPLRRAEVVPVNPCRLQADLRQADDAVVVVLLAVLVLALGGLAVSPRQGLVPGEAAPRLEGLAGVTLVVEDDVGRAAALQLPAREQGLKLLLVPPYGRLEHRHGRGDVLRTPVILEVVVLHQSLNHLLDALGVGEGLQVVGDARPVDPVPAHVELPRQHLLQRLLRRQARGQVVQAHRVGCGGDVAADVAEDATPLLRVKQQGCQHQKHPQPEAACRPLLGVRPQRLGLVADGFLAQLRAGREVLHVEELEEASGLGRRVNGEAENAGHEDEEALAVEEEREA
mmetsp:Transcript_41975/g.130715  ORF Transcript_41975/g.130715 Transcript_41975/m.130715 type:complete len:696 (-) Transcript_41975:263-2350(-)